MNLIKVYYDRIKSLEYSTREALEKLLLTDSRDSYFVIIYFFLCNEKLESYELYKSTSIQHAIYSISRDVKLDGFYEYYNKYANLDEISSQLESLNYELKFAK